MTEEYIVRSIKISKESLDKMNEIKKSSGRTQQWVINAALDKFLEEEWDRLIH